MRVAVLTLAELGARMTGPGWRAWGLASTLSRAGVPAEVVAPPGSAAPEPGGPPVVPLPAAAAARWAARADVVITQGAWLSPLRDGGALARPRLVLDLYDPLPLELPAHYAGRATRRPEARYQLALRRLRYWLGTADAALVAEDRQADLALGMVLAGGGGRMADAAGEACWERRLLRVPCGVPPAPPLPEPELPADILGLAWAGGLWGWFDLEAAEELARSLHGEDPRYRLVVVGAQPPGKDGELTRPAPSGPSVHVLPGWRSRAAYLAVLDRCRVGLCLAPPGLESRFAHRTRVLDHLAAGLPTVFTGGDPLGERAAREGWGRVVPHGDAAALLAATRELAEDGPVRSAACVAAAEAAGALAWDRVVEPLLAYLDDPPPRRRARLGWPWSALAHQLWRIPGV
jgi:hypothetical protein